MRIQQFSYRMLKCLGVSSLMFLLTLPVFAQEDSSIKTTQQFWFDYNQKWQLSERVSIGGPIGIKTISTDAWNRYYIKPELVYKMPKMMLKKLKYNEELRGGIEFYYNQNRNGVDVIEITPFQGYSLTWPNRKRLAIRHYLKLRERFQLDTKDWHNKFGLKLSYELSFTFKFHGEVWQYGNGFYLPVSLKFYWNLIDAAVFNNVFRITPGLGYQFSKEWKAAFLIGYNRTRNGVDEQFQTNDIIYRLRIYHTIGKRSKAKNEIKQ